MMAADKFPNGLIGLRIIRTIGTIGTIGSIGNLRNLGRSIANILKFSNLLKFTKLLIIYHLNQRTNLLSEAVRCGASKK